jgi:hypothetical protein
MSRVRQILGPQSSYLGSGLKHIELKFIMVRPGSPRRYDSIEENQRNEMEQNLNIFRKTRNKLRPTKVIK